MGCPQIFIKYSFYFHLLVFNNINECAWYIRSTYSQYPFNYDSHTLVVLISCHFSCNSLELSFCDANGLAFLEFVNLTRSYNNVINIGSADDFEALNLVFGYNQWHVDNSIANVSLAIKKRR